MEVADQAQSEMKYKLSCSNLYEDDRYYWFSELQFNGFYKVDKKTLTPELLFHFPEEDLDAERLYTDIAKVGDWFVFCPFSAKNICLYNEKNKEIKIFSLKEFSKEKKVKYNPCMKFSSLEVNEHIIFFFPYTYTSIVKLDLNSFNLTYLDSPIAQIEQVVREKRNVFLNIYFGPSCEKEGKVYIPLACGSYIAVFYMDKMNFELHSIEGTMLAFNHVYSEGDVFYLTPQIGNDLTCWNEKTGEVRNITLSSEENVNRAIVHSPFFYKNKIYLSAGLQSAVYQVDLERMIAEKLVFVNNIFPHKYELPNLPCADMLCVRQEERLVHFISGKTHDWYTVNLETNETFFTTIWADKVGRKIMSEKSLHLFENSAVNEDVFLGFLKQGNYQNEKKERIETVGKTIFEKTT